MSRRSGSRSSKRRILDTQEDDDEEEEEDGPLVVRRRSSAPSQEDDDDEEEEDMDEKEMNFAFSQQIPEASQTVFPERANERRNLEEMDRDARDKALSSLSRLMLFKALDHEPMDRAKTIKDAGLSGDRISSAAYQEVASRFQNVFGFEIKQSKFLVGVKQHWHCEF
jgi:hypothetical protein